MADLSIQVWDNTNGESPAVMHVPVNDAITVPNAQTLIASINALSNGGFGRQEVKVRTLVAAGTTNRPAAETDQKEIRYRVGFQDNSTLKLYSFTIPVADLSLMGANSEFVDLTAGPGLALKTDFELFGVSELGNPVTLYEIRFVTL